MTKRRRYKKKKDSDRAGRVRISFKILALFIICAMPVFILKTTAAPPQSVNVFLKVQDREILQGEPMPELAAEASIQGRADTVLDKDTGYTLKDLLHDLNQPSACTLTCEADTNTEGTYPIKIALNRGPWDRWEKRINIIAQNAELTVKNPVGEWKGNKFRRYDGSYVTGDFVTSMGDTYYFDEKGKMVTGWKEIQGSDYYFGDSGVLVRNSWIDREESRSYVDDSGKALTGWAEIDDKRYYFGENKLMVTGEMVNGMVTYKFKEDGSLKSEKVNGVDPNRPMVALTFDDGPGERTGELLAKLEEYHAHATFFMLGKKVLSYQEEVKKMKELGCELGNHSFNHANLGKADAGTIRSQIGDTNAKIAAIAGEGATVMRPPYGSVSDRLRENVGMPMIMWNIDTLDWETRNAQATIDCVMSTVKDGDIILMHDIHSETVDAALELIPKLQDAGYQLVTVSEMAAAKGKTLESGGRYSNF